MRLGPVAQAAFGIDVAALARFNQLGAPARGKTLCFDNATKRVVTGGEHDTFKRQFLQGDNPAGKHLANVFTASVGRSDQQRRFDEARILRMCCPRSSRQATQTVGHQYGGCSATEQHLLKPGDPVAAQGALPVMLLNPNIAVAALPPALPVVRAAVLPAREDEDVCRTLGNVNALLLF